MPVGAGVPAGMETTEPRIARNIAMKKLINGIYCYRKYRLFRRNSNIEKINWRSDIVKKITDTREFYAISVYYAIYNGYEYKVELLEEQKVKLLYRITADPCTEFDAFCKCAMKVNWIFPDILIYQINIAF
jgi:hypothetical protein